MAAPVSFSGAASGLNTDVIIEALLTTRQQRIDRINDRISTFQSQKSSLGEIKSLLSSLRDSARDLGSQTFGKRASESSNTDAFTASSSSDADPGNYDITVKTLASNSVAKIGNTVSDTSTDLLDSATGQITLSLNGGESSFVLDLDQNSSSLADIKDQINSQFGDDLEATIIQTNTDAYQLVVSSVNEGAEFSIDEDLGGTSTFTGGTFNATVGDFSAQGTDQTVAGSDARVVVNGIEITRQTNEISDVIDGVTLRLKQGASDTSSESQIDATAEAGTLTVRSDLDDIIGGIQSFVDKFNKANNKINKVSSSGGEFAGDSTLQGLRRELQSIITGFVDGSDSFNVRDDGSAGFTSLSQVGFKTDSKTGTLSFDSSTLRDALEDNYDEVSNLFLGNSTSSNSSVSFLSNSGTPFSGTITLDLSGGTATVGSRTVDIINSDGSITFDVDDNDDLAGLLFFSSDSSASATITISAGIGDEIRKKSDEFAAFSGNIASRQSTIDDQISRLNDSLDLANLKLEDERQRLTQVFARSEQAISQLQGLQSSLGAFGI